MAKLTMIYPNGKKVETEAPMQDCIELRRLYQDMIKGSVGHISNN